VKICSLLPSATEIVFALGLGERLVAVTHECDFPPEARGLPVVTRSTLRHDTRDSRAIHHHIASALHAGSSIYSLDQAELERVDPDLILTQELCDVCAVSYELVAGAVQKLHGARRVLSLEPTSLPGILATIEQVGAMAGVPDRAATLVAALRRRVETVAALTATLGPWPRVYAMEWLDPPFTAGHWVPEMVRLAGGRDTLGREGQPSAQIAWPRIVDDDPEIIVLIPCGFTLEQTVEAAATVEFPDAWDRLTAVREGRVYAANGSAYFNRPGPRIVDGLEILAEILHPELFPPRWQGRAWQPLTRRGAGMGQRATDRPR
jgi:iron complex transport system substrate-binding protein